MNMSLRQMTTTAHQIIFKPVDYLNKSTKIIEHLRQNYYKNSPLHKYLGWSDSYAAELDHIIMSRFLTQKLSVVAVDMETNEIAGVRINIEGTQNALLINNADSGEHSRSPQFEKVRRIKKLLVDRALLNEEYHGGRGSGVEQKECVGVLVSVSLKYRNCGIARELYIRSHDLLKSQGFTIIKPFVSSPIARNITLELGYKELSRVYFDEMIGSDGLPDFKFAEPGMFISYMVKEL